jgi:hypothetical protein
LPVCVAACGQFGQRQSLNELAKASDKLGWLPYRSERGN